MHDISSCQHDFIRSRHTSAKLQVSPSYNQNDSRKHSSRYLFSNTLQKVVYGLRGRTLRIWSNSSPPVQTSRPISVTISGFRPVQQSKRTLVQGWTAPCGSCIGNPHLNVNSKTLKAYTEMSNPEMWNIVLPHPRSPTCQGCFAPARCTWFYSLLWWELCPLLEYVHAS